MEWMGKNQARHTWGIPRMIRRRLSATVSVDVDRLWIVDGFDDDNDDEYVDSVTRRITE